MLVKKTLHTLLLHTIIDFLYLLYTFIYTSEFMGIDLPYNIGAFALKFFY